MKRVPFFKVVNFTDIIPILENEVKRINNLDSDIKINKVKEGYEVGNDNPLREPIEVYFCYKGKDYIETFSVNQFYFLMCGYINSFNDYPKFGDDKNVEDVYWNVISSDFKESGLFGFFNTEKLDVVGSITFRKEYS